MSDRISYIQAGVRYAWMVTYNGGEQITEFDENGHITKLKDVDWNRVVEFCAYGIEQAIPSPVIRFPFSSRDKPIWFHRSVGYVGDRGTVVPESVIDFIGVEAESHKHYACLLEDGSIRILFEAK